MKDLSDMSAAELNQEIEWLSTELDGLAAEAQTDLDEEARYANGLAYQTAYQRYDAALRRRDKIAFE